jgi:four helix bundle protein
MTLSLWGVMRTTQQASSLDILLGVLPLIARLTDRIKRHDRNLADHTRRAATSTALNLAEDDGHRAGNRRNRLDIAQGELHETRMELKIAATFGYVGADEAAGIDRQLDRVAAMTWRRRQRC